MEFRVRTVIKQRLIPKKRRMLYESLETLGLYNFNLDAIAMLEQDDFKSAYRRMALRHHPDLWEHKGGHKLQQSKQNFVKIQSANQLLNRFVECRDSFVSNLVQAAS